MSRRSTLLWLTLLTACPKPSAEATAPPEPPSIPAAAAAPKNVILFIGDGMGPSQVGLLELFAKHSPSGAYTSSETSFSRMSRAGSVGLSLHEPKDRLVVDSACSATQLATGVAALSEVISVDDSGQPLETVLEKAERAGWRTGLVSDTRITHATPAAFAAHVSHRRYENEIAAQLVDSGAEVLLSGGKRYFVPQGKGSKRKDDRDLLAEARDKGFTVLETREGLETATAPLLGLFASSGMLDGITDHATRGDEEREQPSLLEMTQTAVRVLDQGNDTGFFLMVEAGQIDWAAHANDAGQLLHEMVKADEALHWLLDYVEDDGETLLVVTADHETGGFGFSYSRAGLPNEAQELGGVFTAETPYQPDWNFGPASTLDKLWAQKAPFFGALIKHSRQTEFTDAEVAEITTSLNDLTEFSITEEATRRVLATEPNPTIVDGHKYLRHDTFPAFHDYEDFYVYGMDGRTNLVARELASQSNVVWSTGTHTHAPVPVFAVGPGASAFGVWQHHTDIGQKLKALVPGE